VRAELADLETLRRAFHPPRSVSDSVDFCAWWSVFATYANAVFDVLTNHLLPAARDSVTRARVAGHVYDDACAVFFKDFLPGIAAEIELSRDLLANVDSKHILLARFPSQKTHLQAVSSLGTALAEAVPHLTDLIACVYDEIGAVLSAAPLTDRYLAELHSTAATTIMASTDTGWPGIVLLTRSLPDRHSVVDAVPAEGPFRHTANRIAFHKSCRWMERNHFAVVNRAIKILRRRPESG
jgi:hypothetical protein